MKTFLKNCGRLAVMAASLALAGTATQSLAQPSPVGTWDCIMSGNGQKGILFLNFTADVDSNLGLPTFEGIYVQAGHMKIATGRAGSTGNSRSGATSPGSFTNLFGGGFINGTAAPVADNGGPNDWLEDSRGHRGNWYFNSKGLVVGSYYTVLNASSHVTNFFSTCVDEVLSVPLTNGGFFNVAVDFCFTNPVIVTNFPWGPAPDGEFGFTNLAFTNFNFTIGSVGLTNNISFVGKVVPGKRLTMTGSSAFGNFTIRGVPLQSVSTALPIAGPGIFWTGNKIQTGFRFVEQFGLNDTTIPNVFGMTGQGPSYTYTPDMSMCMISSQKQIGFSVVEIPFGADTNSEFTVVNRATVGNFVNNKKKIGGNTQGDSSADINVMTFDANLSPFTFP